MEGKPSEKTSLSQSRALAQVLDIDLPLDQLTQAHLMSAVKTMRKTVAVATSNRRLETLSRAIKHMGLTHGAKVPEDIDWRRLKEKEPTERVRELSIREQHALFENLRDDLHPLVQFALLTGARRATICELKWSDIDFDVNRMKFQMKGGGQMLFPMNQEITDLFASLPRARTPGTRGYVFTFLGQDGAFHPLNATGGHIWEHWRAALAAADIQDFRFHDLRHTFATRMLRQTNNLKLVSKLLGHKDLGTTMRYAHVLDSDLKQAMGGYSVRPATEMTTPPDNVLKIKGAT